MVGNFPSFETMINSLNNFLAEENCSKNLVWIFREDVICYKKTVFIKYPICYKNSELAKEYYNFGKKNGLGIQLEVFCLLKNCPCCFVWVPKNQLDADYSMLSGVKMKIPITLLQAKTVTSNIFWKLLTWWITIAVAKNKNISFANEIPSRYLLQNR